MGLSHGQEPGPPRLASLMSAPVLGRWSSSPLAAAPSPGAPSPPVPTTPSENSSCPWVAPQPFPRAHPSTPPSPLSPSGSHATLCHPSSLAPPPLRPQWTPSGRPPAAPFVPAATPLPRRGRRPAAGSRGPAPPPWEPASPRRDLPGGPLAWLTPESPGAASGRRVGPAAPGACSPTPRTDPSQAFPGLALRGKRRGQERRVAGGLSRSAAR